MRKRGQRIQGTCAELLLILKSFYDFSYFSSAIFSSHRLQEKWVIIYEILFMWGCLCSLSIFGCLNTRGRLLPESYHSFHLMAHFEILRFFILHWPYCMEISPPLMLCIYFTITSIVFQCELKWAGLQRAGIAHIFLVSAGVCLLHISYLSISTSSETPREQKRLMTVCKSDRIRASWGDSFETRLSELLPRQSWAQE